MVEYIERETFLDAIERMKPYQQDADDIAETLQNFPAADVRPVVLCRDCKYWELSKIDPSFHVCTYVCGATFVRNVEDFCSRGEKGEGS